MKIFRYSVIFIFFFAFIQNSIPQIYSIHHYSTEEGVATRGVKNIVQDRTGRMWFSTGLGVSMYDGFSWTNYGSKENIPRRNYTHIICDEKGIIWAAPNNTTHNIIFYSNNKWEKLEAIAETVESGKEISGFGIYYEEDKPVICVSTYSGAYVFNDNKWRLYTVSDGLMDNFIFSLCTRGTEFLLSTVKGISVVSKGKIDNSINNYIPPGFGPVLKITLEKTNEKTESRLWLLGSDKVAYIEDSRFKEIKSDFKLPAKGASDNYFLTPDGEETVYFGNTWLKYCVNIHTGESHILNIDNGFSSEGNDAAYKDREGKIWFAGFRGIDKLNTIAFRNHTKMNILAENEVSAVTEISPNVFILGHNSGISISKNYNFRYIKFDEADFFSSTYRVLDLYSDSKGNAWIAASYRGAGKIDENGNLEWYNTPGVDYISSVCRNGTGNILFSGNGDLYELKNGNIVRVDFVKSGSFNFRKIFCFENDTVWGVGMNGIIRITGGKSVIIKNSGEAAEKNCFSVFKDDDGNILAGTENGLYSIVNDSLVKFSSRDFEISDAVFAITKDKKNGYYFFGTSNNLVRWDGKSSVKKYNSYNGLVEGEINRSAVFLDSRNNLWIGTDAGLSKYIPGLDYGKEFIPSPEILFVEDFQGNRYSGKDEITLRNENTSLVFSIRGISFVEERLLEYRIKLEGYDKDWILIHQRDIGNIVYKNLAPGTYKFKMQARNFSGKWSEEISSGEITAKGMFYKQWWFMLTVLLIVIFNILYVYKHILRRKYTKSLEANVRQRTSELYESQGKLKHTLATLEDKVKERTEELSLSESKFRSIIEQASDGIVIYEMDTRKVILTNQAYADMLGYSKEEMLKLTIYDLVAHERESIDNYINGLVMNDNVFIKERFHRRKNGSLVPVEVSVKAVQFPETRMMCMLARDISERLKSQQELRQSEEKYRTLIENADDIILMLDIDLNIILANNNYYESLGLEKNHFIGIETLLHPDDVSIFNKAKENLLLSGNNQAEFRLRRADGRWLYFSSKSILVRDRDDVPVNILTILRDITEKKNIEKALHESEKKFRELVEQLPAAVYETDTNGIITFVNKTGLEMFGYGSNGNIVGKSLMDFASPSVRAEAAEKFRSTIFGVISEGYEFQGYRKDGTSIPIHINAVPLMEDGVCTGVRGVVLDISEKIASRNKLETYAEELKKLNATKDKFFSIIAHDLRAPFTGFLGLTELLYQESEGMHKEEVMNYAGLMRNSAKNLFELIENLLQWGRLQTGGLKIRKKIVNLSTCVVNAMNLLRYNYEKKEITVKNKVDPDTFVTGDDHILVSVLQNFVANAIKFTHRKGAIEISAEKRDANVIVTVKDNGVGIKPDMIEKLFRLDAQTTTAGTENEAGTGLGLIICKEMIERLGGYIEIQSKVNEGTAVIFGIPAAD